MLIQYDDPLQEIEQLSTTISDEGRIPIVWSKARGLMVKQLSRQYPLFQDTQVADLNEPQAVIKFIISKPQDRVDYILEDFHHYIGGRDAVNPEVGGIRSLIKDLYRNLEKRDERVYLFVPTSYDLPPSRAPFSAMVQNAPENRATAIWTDTAGCSPIRRMCQV